MAERPGKESQAGGGSFSYAEFAREIAKEHGVDPSVLTGRETPPTKEEEEKEFLLAEVAKKTPEVRAGNESLHEQYDSQLQILNNLQILEQLPSSDRGIRGIDGKGYMVPSWEEIQQRIEVESGLIDTKEKQGFDKLLLVPFGINLATLIKKYEKALVDHEVAGRLLDSDGNPANVDLDRPVWVWDEYGGADVSGKLVYYPEQYTKKKHNGKTKKELLERGQGWHVILIQDQPDLPKEGLGKTKAGRAELEANKTPNEYLEILKKGGSYEDEQPFTPEDWLVYAITKLEEEDRVVDDWQGKGVATYNLGAYFPGTGYVADANWYRDDRQAGLSGNTPDVRDSDIGARSAVRI